MHILYGNNPYEISRAKQKILEKSPLSSQTVDASAHSLLTFQPRLGSTDLFNPKNLFVIENLSTQKDWNGKALEWLETLDSELIDVIVYEPAIDLRSSFARSLKKNEHAEDFRHLSDRALIDWVVGRAAADKLELDGSLAQYLIERVGTDQWRLENELQKLRLLGKKISSEVIDQHTTALLQVNVFQFLDALFARQSSAEDRLQELVDSGAHHIYIITMIGWSLQNYLALRFRKDRSLRELAELTQIKEGVLSRAERNSRLTSGQVKALIAATLQADIDAKTRKIIPSTHLRQLLAEYQEILR